MPFPPLRFERHTLKLLDQRRLPRREVWLDCRTSRQVHRAIRQMVVRGAPAIGVAGGYGLYLGVRGYEGGRGGFLRRLRSEAAFLKAARPTGVNLCNIIDRIVGVVTREGGEWEVSEMKERVLAEARRAHREDDRLCRSIGRHGARLFRSGDRVLTHCNAGGLATSGYGTALGVIYAGKAMGKRLSVFVDETRPLLQGSRLTAWELAKSRIPCTLLCDNTAATLMQQGRIDRVLVGADRIAANGDTANKIGTYNLAVLARRHGIPFYIAAPSTTFDFKIRSGRAIPIESRDGREVTEGFGKPIAPRGISVVNLAFDVTPHGLISAFITEIGLLRPPFRISFRRFQKALRKAALP